MRRELRDRDKKTDHLGFDDYVVNGWWLQGRQAFAVHPKGRCGSPQGPLQFTPRALAVHPKGGCGSPQAPLRFTPRAIAVHPKGPRGASQGPLRLKLRVC